MLLALVTILSVTAIVGAVLTAVVRQQTSTRFDQRFSTSIQGADAGVQSAYFAINSLPLSSTVTSLSSTSPVVEGATSYTWTATRSSGTALSWDVTSTGTTTESGTATTSRTVTARIAQSPLFPLAAFADSSVTFNGNNKAVSYPDPGFGVVGTNGTLTLKGASTEVDGASLYDYDAHPDLSRCSGTGCPASSDISTIGERLDITSAVETGGFIQQQLDVCKAAGPLQAFVGTSISPKADGSPYCFTSFNADTQNFLVGGDPSQVVKVFVDGGDVVFGNKNHSDVNNDIAGAPTSIRLQIYTTGTSVTMYNQSNVAAAVYAPNAACSGQTSNASSDFYGSMVCKTISNVGGWTFHYDTRLGAIGDGMWAIQRYAEP